MTMEAVNLSDILCTHHTSRSSLLINTSIISIQHLYPFAHRLKVSHSLNSSSVACNFKTSIESRARDRHSILHTWSIGTQLPQPNEGDKKSRLALS